MHLRKISCKEHWIEVIEHRVQWRASMMDTLQFRTAYRSVQVQEKSADTRYKTDRVPFNNLYYAGCFFLISDRSPQMGTQRIGLAAKGYRLHWQEYRCVNYLTQENSIQSCHIIIRCICYIQTARNKLVITGN